MEPAREKLHLLTRQLVEKLTTSDIDISLVEQVYSNFTKDTRSKQSTPLQLVLDSQQFEDHWKYSKFSNIISRLSDKLEAQGLADNVYLYQLLSGSGDPLHINSMDRVVDNLRDFRLHEAERQQFSAEAGVPLEEGGELVGLSIFGEYLQFLHSQQQPSSDHLMRELPYALQGLKNESFEWVKAERGAEKATGRTDGLKPLSDVSPGLRIPPTLPFPLIGLLHKLLEPALLYQSIKGTTSISRSSEKPLITQALHSAMQKELQNYLALIGVIENEVREKESVNQTTTFTLKRCHALLHDATLGLRFMYSVLVDCEILVGGQILSLVHGYTYHGDVFVSRFAKRLLRKISLPFYGILKQWIRSGTLVDPYKEFFVAIGDESSQWKDLFVFDKNKVPSYMGYKVAKTVYETGKSLYFIRVACADQEWINQRNSTEVIADSTSAEDYEKLGQKLKQGHEEVVRHLNYLLRHKFHLNHHMRALKDYLLLSKGDFAQLLIEEAAPVLSLPSVQLYRHQLTSLLETAILGSNARLDNEAVLSCLDARMLELGHGDIGWDLFTLDYTVSSPLDIVLLDSQSNRQYLKVFNFLWRLKRVSFSLYETWKNITNDDRRRRTTTKRSQPAISEPWLLACRNTCQLMLHFVDELQYYITFEVIEMGWTECQKTLGFIDADEEGKLTVDEIIAAHTAFLARITYKGLLGGEKGYMGDLHEILKKALLFVESAKEVHRLSLRYDANTQRLSRLNKIGDSIGSLHDSFERRVANLVTKLDGETDDEMRFLGVRLDFNGYYTHLIEAAFEAQEQEQELKRKSR